VDSVLALALAVLAVVAVGFVVLGRRNGSPETPA
jgi:ABC-type antimicrobial peptide transport system permease subunit